MSPETIQAIQKALEPVAEKIGQGAQYGWMVVVKQQYIEGVVGIFDFAGAVVVFILSLLFAIIGGRNTDWNADVSGWGIVCLASCAIAFFAFFAVLFSWPDVAIQHLLNPDYYALDFFIHLGSNATK